jgi:hypothetical protein
MSLENRANRYSGPKLFPDSEEVIYDTDLKSLPEGAQKVYLKGGYHTLVGYILKDQTFARTLTAEQEAFLRNRLARELIDCTASAHKDQYAVDFLIKHFDSKANPSLSLNLAQGARHLAVEYIRGEMNTCDLIE